MRRSKTIYSLKSRHYDAIIELYKAVGSGRFIHAYIAHLGIHPATLSALHIIGCLKSCGTASPSYPTKIWQISPDFLPELEEMFGKISSAKESERVIRQYHKTRL